MWETMECSTQDGSLDWEGSAAATTGKVVITIGGVPADVQFSGLVSAGLYQFNVVIPKTASGDQALQATVAGVKTPDGVVLAVQ